MPPILHPPDHVVLIRVVLGVRDLCGKINRIPTAGHKVSLEGIVRTRKREARRQSTGDNLLHDFGNEGVHLSSRFEEASEQITKRLFNRSHVADVAPVLRLVLLLLLMRRDVRLNLLKPLPRMLHLCPVASIRTRPRRNQRQQIGTQFRVCMSKADEGLSGGVHAPSDPITVLTSESRPHVLVLRGSQPSQTARLREELPEALREVLDRSLPKVVV